MLIKNKKYRWTIKCNFFDQKIQKNVCFIYEVPVSLCPVQLWMVQFLFFPAFFFVLTFKTFSCLKKNFIKKYKRYIKKSTMNKWFHIELMDKMFNFVNIVVVFVENKKIRYLNKNKVRFNRCHPRQKIITSRPLNLWLYCEIQSPDPRAFKIKNIYI